MMAAYTAASSQNKVVLLDKNDRLGKKLFITGKGRCNITNNCDTADFFKEVVRNPKFLMSAVYGFSSENLIQILNENGVPTKIERGGRVFPISDKSNDVLKALERMLHKAQVDVRLNTTVLGVQKQGDLFTVETDRGSVAAKNVILATGGVSYPLTGSTGDGYVWAEKLGHRLVPASPALIPLEDEHNICAKMQGLALKNVTFTLYQNNKCIYTEQGELLFTHFGISGPEVLSASSYINYSKNTDDLYCTIDLKPALNKEKLEARLLRDFAEHKNKQLKTYMSELMPSKLIHPFLAETRLDGQMQINEITKETRKKLVDALKAFRIKIAGARPIGEAIVTAGGVAVKDINPSTMESKVIPGLYFAGELVDVSAQTGGYNLQIAFSTGYLAGSSVHEF